ncbi:MAG: hypothetical protein WC849_03225 [Candidatus Paceibacterota bacterium]
MTQLVQTINTGFGSMNHVLNKQIAKTSKTEKRIFYILTFFLVIVSVSYIYFMGSTIQNTAQRTNIESEIKTISSQISGLELEYLSAKNNLTLDYAYSIGFKDVKKINYISKKPELNGITLNGTIK